MTDQQLVVQAVNEAQRILEETSNHDPRTTSAFSPNWWKFSNGPIWLSP